MNINRLIIFFILAASLAGLILSALLILEYFGLASAAADVVCERGSGVNSCTIVSASPFASIKGVPLIGDVPTAVFGFMFYGFIAVITFMHIIRRNDDENMQIYLLILILSAIAIVGDIALNLISVFIIKFLCPLCSMTYAATAVIIISSVILVKNNRIFTGKPIIIQMKKYFMKHILNYVVIAFVFAAVGISIGHGARAIAQTKKASTYEERLQKAIRQYETAKPINLSLDETPVSGKPAALAKFVIFFDFTCVHCRTEFLVFEKLIKKYPDEMSVAFKFFPLNGHCGMLQKGRDDREADACIASAAAFCAHNQGKFMEYAKILFESYHFKDMEFSIETVRKAAKNAGLDPAGFDLCFGSRTAIEFVRTQYMETEALNINSTPTLFLNGKKLTAGSRKEDIIEGLIRYCIEKNKQARKED
ncbi:MAG: thioredoxin domain-containing protein [Spirochaetes bacterium]|nr:thioredoxin domain-containing protein [Spirochaetota bacterium]